jgi:hypothetical protein
MSETSAKSIRAAREAKAKRLGSAGDPKQKVDASTWTPPEMMNTNAKTGLRPVSRRAFKRGGKVGMEAEGSCGPTRADRKPRKSGGEAKTWVAAKVNRDVKEANAELGKPHVGGMKKGGRAKRQTGGMLPEGARQGIQRTSALMARDAADEMARRQLQRENPPPPPPSEREAPLDNRSTRELMDRMQDGMKKGGRTKKMDGGMASALGLAPAMMMDREKEGKKHGGRTKKMDGGMSGDPRQGAAAMMQKAAAMGNVPQDRMGFSRLQKGRAAMMAGLKKGGKVSHQEWEHSKADLKQDQKLAKKHGMSMEKWEKSALDAKHDKQQSAEGLKKGGAAGNYTGGTRPTGGRIAKKAGGRAKGKTNIIISINPGAGAAQQQGMMPPGNLPPGGGMRPGAGGLPVPVAGPPGAAAPPPMPMPVPVPMPMGAGAGGPPMPPPGAMPRKAGGRAYRSYKDMDAGAGSGLGRLEKTEIQEHKRGERKAGGRTYRSYKDMDAGAGSGLGRLEKTEIQARKR